MPTNGGRWFESTQGNLVLRIGPGINAWCAVHGVRQGTACVHRFDSDGNIIIIPVVIEGANKIKSWFESAAAHSIILGGNMMEISIMTKEELVEKNLDLLNENALLKSEITRIHLEEDRNECRVKELEKLCKDLQEQHQQDCIRYNNMQTAFLMAVDELAMMRKHFGVGQ